MWRSSAVQGKKIWLRKVANVKEEIFMAFQGRQRMLSDLMLPNCVHLRGEWPSGLYSLRQVTEVKLGRVRSDFEWVTSED